MSTTEKWCSDTDPREYGDDLATIEEVHIERAVITKISTDLNWVTGCENLEKLRIHFQPLQIIDGLTGLTKLAVLNLGCNNIKAIGNLESLTGLKELRLSENKIEKIEGLTKLINLTNLYLDDNQISEIAGLSDLVNLEVIGLSKNRIKEINGLSGLKKLRNLYLSRNVIGEIGENSFSGLENLQNLYLINNRIKSIRGLSGLSNLRDLMLDYNQIEEIGAGLTGLPRLMHLYLSGNRLTEVSGFSEVPNLATLDLSQNPQITYVPNLLVYCPRLELLYLTGNRVETYHPVIEEFLLRFAVNTMVNSFAVYSDEQSVHLPSVQTSIRKNIVRLLETDRLTPFRDAEEVTESILCDSSLSEEAKKAIIEYSTDVVNEVSTLPGVKFADVLIPVWNRVMNLTDLETAIEVKRVLTADMVDAECVCFTGRISRLVNCLTGFFPDLIVEISKSEQLSNIVLLTKQKLSDSSSGYNREAHVDLVKTEMTERGYTPEEIEEWTSAIE